MIRTAYGPLPDEDDAHDLVIIRLEAIGQSDSIHDATLAYMIASILDDPEMEMWVRSCDDDDFAEWLSDIEA